MQLRLKVPKSTLPQACEFKEPLTGKVFDPYTHGVMGVVSQIIEHRASNETLFPREKSELFDPRFIAQEIYAVANKVRPDLFQGYSETTVSGVVTKDFTPQKPCACGRTQWEPVYCPTCGGGRGRITSYKCGFCGLSA